MTNWIMVGKHTTHFATNRNDIQKPLLEDFLKTVPRGQPSCVAWREVTISEVLNFLICKVKWLGLETSWSLKYPSSLHIILPGSVIKGEGPWERCCTVRRHTEKLGIFRKSLRHLWHHFTEALLSDFSICYNNNTLVLAQKFRCFFLLNPHN